jgi:hypothetical protein
MHPLDGVSDRCDMTSTGSSFALSRSKAPVLSDATLSGAALIELA